MQESKKQLISKILPRLDKAARAKAIALEEDFWVAIDAVTSQLSDEQLLETDLVTICYQSIEGDGNIYRSNYASIDGREVKYEEEPHSIGTKSSLERVLSEFVIRIEKDDKCVVLDFDVDKMFLSTVSKFKIDFLLFEVKSRKPKSRTKNI